MRVGTFLALIGFLAIVGLIAAGVYYFGGFYSVAATREDPGIVKWMLGQVRNASVARHATEPPPMALDDAAVREGARAYSVRGCPACHGAPGVNWEKFSEGMRPYPPNLKDLAKEREPQQLFWAIRNGINMTGMPGFALIQVPDREIWTIAAFVKKLPEVSEQDYKTWSAPPVVTPVPSPR
jgi:mono/diheme cytochrome c family protein